MGGKGRGMGGEGRGGEGRGGEGRESLTRNKGPINLMESVIGAWEGEGIPQDNGSHRGSEHTRRRATTWRETEINTTMSSSLNH